MTSSFDPKFNKMCSEEFIKNIRRGNSKFKKTKSKSNIKQKLDTIKNLALKSIDNTEWMFTQDKNPTSIYIVFLKNFFIFLRKF